MPSVVIRYCNNLSIIDAITACIMFLYKTSRKDKDTVCLGSFGNFVVEIDKKDKDYLFNVDKDLDVSSKQA